MTGWIMKGVTWLLVFLSSSKISIQIENVSLAKIALVEFHPRYNLTMSHQERVNANAAAYIQILKTLSQDYELDLIVFPEITLDSSMKKDDMLAYSSKIIPLSNPCKEIDYPEFVKNLSCAAKQYHTCIVFNLLQYEEKIFYPADVLIDPHGYISYSNKRENQIGNNHFDYAPIPFEIPSYKFFNIGMPGKKSTSKRFSLTSAITGFRFSYEKMIISNDPSSVNYLISSNWISQLPFLTSFQVHQMWAQEMQINIFFSGLNNPKFGEGGTGIYHFAAGPVFMDVAAKGDTRSYVYSFTSTNAVGEMETPIIEENIDVLAEQMDDFYMKKDPDLKRYESKILNTSGVHFEDTICYNKESNNHCCYFNIRFYYNYTLTSSKTQYTYLMVAYKGRKTYYSVFKPGGVEVCAVVACLNTSLSSCGERFKNYRTIAWPITFQEITIKANFASPYKEKIYYSSQFPNSLLSSMRPLHPNATRWTKTMFTNKEGRNVTLQRTFTLIEPQNRLYTFGIFARNFSLVEVKSGSVSLTKYKLNFVVAFVGLCLIKQEL